MDTILVLRLAVDSLAVAKYEEEKAVRSAREAGVSWDQIGQVYGVTRQAAHARWHGKEEAWKTN